MKSLLELLKSDPDCYRISFGFYIEFLKPVSLFANNLNLANYKLVVISGRRFVPIEELLTSLYMRAVFYVIEYDTDLDFTVNDRGDHTEVNQLRNCKSKLSICSHTVNESVLFIRGTNLLLAAPEGDPNIDPVLAKLLEQFKNALEGLKENSNFREEYFGSNMDDSEYGVMNGKLYIVKEEDPFVRQFICFEPPLNKSTDSGSTGLPLTGIITFYYFGESLYEMESHILTRFVRYHSNKLVAEVDFNMQGKICSGKDCVLEIPLKLCTISKSEVLSVVKLFNRRLAYDSD